MIRATVTLDAETLAGIERVVEHCSHMNPAKVRAIMTEVEEGKADFWRAMRENLHKSFIAYHCPPSLLYPRFPISHPFKRGNWNLPVE